jgi:hypothetical protein
LKEKHETLEKEYTKLKNAHERELAKIAKERQEFVVVERRLEQ